MAVTIRDIAEKVGVAPSTISRVLNNKADARVTEKTRRRILNTARELGYAPNLHAQALTSGRSSLINFVVGTIENQALAMKAWRLHAVVRQLGHEVMSTDVSSLSDLERAAQVLLVSRPSAVVWLYHQWKAERLSQLFDRLHSEEVYTLFVDCPKPLPASIPCDALMVSRADGAYLATSHLIERGHRNIGLIATEGTSRLEGYVRALNEHGIERRYVEFHDPADPPGGGKIAAQRLLGNYPDVSAIFCNSDLVAVGVMQGLDEMGIRVPEDMAVVGYDNDPWTAFLPVPLTTVAHPVDELCRQTLSLLEGRLDGDESGWRRIEIGSRLIVRASSSPEKRLSSEGR